VDAEEVFAAVVVSEDEGERELDGDPDGGEVGDAGPRDAGKIEASAPFCREL